MVRIPTHRDRSFQFIVTDFPVFLESVVTMS